MSIFMFIVVLICIVIFVFALVCLLEFVLALVFLCVPVLCLCWYPCLRLRSYLVLVFVLCIVHTYLHTWSGFIVSPSRQDYSIYMYIALLGKDPAIIFPRSPRSDHEWTEIPCRKPGASNTSSSAHKSTN